MDTSSAFEPADIFSAKGLVVAITGGGSGIGLAMASSILQTGAAKVYILGRRLDVLSSAASSIDPSKKTVVPLQCDVTSVESTRSAVQQIEREVGYLDVLINNAGLIGPPNKPALEAQNVEELQKVLLTGFEDGSWESTLKVNTASIVAVSASFLLLLDKGNKRRGWQSGKIAPEETRKRSTEGLKDIGVGEDDLRTSQIITTASIASFNRQVTAGLAYSASKAGAVHIGKMLATLLLPWGIRSNVIAPGIYPSQMTGESDQTFPLNQVPAGRKGNFNDMAGVTLYLVGKSGAYVNGNVVVTDGGRLSGFPSSY
ncbi:uncharacterized protein K452DRAFT_348023 [Aplosporella prunicola CBS 121167]|uniref:NAD(P)-binding protein n=1 Tax=Aplosporella prunicola CBS 121167 TaxID=1176127 RepID=A0A6A6BT07_9PEZI|nr:uncharacterized protein K452DRAFT_348023 [Aplosporella prunicola CBS 121167]KAF2147226.1 hypothetical protein K452DRAFT_348023 [Aplosporella prunicola CBS 121167]